MTATAAPPTPTPAAPTTVRAGPLAGTTLLARFVLRRDRIRLPLWVGAILLFLVGSAASLPTQYADAAERQARAALVDNPGVRAFTGPGFGLDDYTFGAIIVQELFGYTAILVALMVILLTVRHTRAEEETGRAELVRAAAVGRHAHLAAVLLVVGAASLLTGGLIALGLGSLGLEDVDWASSWLLGAAVASIGLVFTAVTAVTVQVSAYARGASGLAAAAFAVAYLLRAAGDATQIGGGTWSWLSPIGWAQQTRAYVDNRWWPLLLSLALTVLLVAAAAWLTGRRDLAAGLMPPRPGPATAHWLLSSPLGLGWRLHRTSLSWWATALLLFGLAYGSITAEIETFVAELVVLEEWMAEIGGQTLLDAFFAVIILLLAIIVTIFAVPTVLRLRSEETGRRAEPVLATATSRTRWAASHLTIALAGSAVLLLTAALGLGLSAAAALGDPSVLPRLLGAALAHVPAIWLIVGLALALFGLIPRAVTLVWVVVAYSATIGYFGDFLGLPDWTATLSPFAHIPLLPAEPFTATPIVAMTFTAAALIAAGLAALRRRDLTTPA